MIDDTSQTGSGFDFTWGYDVKFLPTSNFDVDSLVGCGTLTANFVDNCIYNPSTNYNFNYGDGTPPVTGSEQHSLCHRTRMARELTSSP